VRHYRLTEYSEADTGEDVHQLHWLWQSMQ
jgi:hypothetical protein